MSHAEDHDEDRRDFLYYATAGAGAVVAGAAIWPLVNQMNPSADVQAMSSIRVDISGVAEGTQLTVKWRGKPVFIRHRTEEEIKEAESVELSALPDPQADADRVEKPEWLVMVGVCTHLGCIPLGQKPGDSKGDFGGWFCPCHGSHYDTSGRIRKGPAPANLPVPAYEFTDDTNIRIG